MKKRKRSSSKTRLKKVLSHWKGNGDKFVHVESSIEKSVKEILIEINAPFIQEYRMVYGKQGRNKFYDFYVYRLDSSGDVAWRFFVECHGTFFHAEDYVLGKKKKEQLYSIQKKNIKNDGVKKRIADKAQIPIIYLWESQINNRREWVKKILIDIIDSMDFKLKNNEYVGKINEELLPTLKAEKKKLFFG